MEVGEVCVCVCVCVCLSALLLRTVSLVAPAPLSRLPGDDVFHTALFWTWTELHEGNCVDGRKQGRERERERERERGVTRGRVITEDTGVDKEGEEM